MARRTSSSTTSTATGPTTELSSPVRSPTTDLRVAVYPNGKVDPGHSHQMELKLQDGTFRLNIAKLEQIFFEHVEHGYVPSSCSHFVSFETPVPIVAGSGTGGAYRGIAGSFEMTVTADEVHMPCSPPFSGPPSWEVIVLAGSGTITA